MNEEFNADWKRMTEHVIVVVQNKPELFALASIMRNIGVESYLEIGASCGGSVLLLGRIPTDRNVLVDLFEEKSEQHLMRAIDVVTDFNAGRVIAIKGDSRSEDVANAVAECGPYDVVMIDGGHDYDTVMSDYMKYAPMARKLVAFHDINQPGVRRVWEEIGGGLSISDKNSTMGYGLIFK